MSTYPKTPYTFNAVRMTSWAGNAGRATYARNKDYEWIISEEATVTTLMPLRRPEVVSRDVNCTERPQTAHLWNPHSSNLGSVAAENVSTPALRRAYVII
jgi:hypothetical protein